MKTATSWPQPKWSSLLGAQLARFVTELAWDTPPNFASFSGLLKAAFTGRLAAIVIQTCGKQFATMPIADPTVPLQ